MIGHGGFGTTMGALAAGVPQVVVPLFSFDQIVNGEHVAAVGAGLTVERGPAAVEQASAWFPDCWAIPPTPPRPSGWLRRCATLPPATEAVPVLTGLAG